MNGNYRKKGIYFIFGLGFLVLIITSLTIGYADQPNNNLEQEDISGDTRPSENEEIIEEQPIQETMDLLVGLLIGYDKSGLLTDVLMIGYLDVETHEVKIISIPRDMFIDFRDEPFKTIKEENPNNKVLYCKLNEVYYHLGHDERAIQDVEKIIQEIIGVEIDYYATVDLEAFREIVDLVDGVEFYVPQNMNYEDPLQDLYIHLEEGLQVLDGEKAEQLVRYRHAYGDLVRIEVQREFLTALVKEVLEDTNLQKLLDIVKTAYEYVETDLAFMDALKYSQLIFDSELKMDTENMLTIPTYGEKIDGLWYEMWDEEEIEELINNYLTKE